MAMEIGEVKVVIIDILFMKIKENRRKGRWKVTSLHVRKIEGKIVKIEENRGLNDKKASQDQFTTFDNFMVELSLYSLILLHT